MATQTIQLGKSSLLSLYGKFEVRITKLCGQRKTKLFCKKHEELITPKFSSEHGCLKPQRVYQNKEGKTIVIFCPHLMTLKGEPFYKEHESLIYESLEGILEINPQSREKPERPQFEQKEDFWSKQQRNLRKLVEAGKIVSEGRA